MVSWDVLISTIPHRHEQLCALLGEFDRQAQDGFGVRVLRDNLERPGIRSYLKWQDLLESSEADYVCWIGDDDWVDPEYVARIMGALELDPDYVGFPVKFTENGVPQCPVDHSLRYGGWLDGPVYERDICHSNPIRRKLALLTSWTDQAPDEDSQWASRLRSSGQVTTEVYLKRELYWYQRGTENFWARRQPMDAADISPLPEYPWLTAL